MIQIPSDKYGHNLLLSINNYACSCEEKDLLIRILKLDVCDRWNRETTYSAKFSEIEIDIIIEQNWCESENIQVKAFCLDILSRVKRKNISRLDYLKSASAAYFQLSKTTCEYWYLLRSITVRQAKVLYNDIFLNEVIEFISEYLNPYWLVFVAKALSNSYQNKQLEPLYPIINKGIMKVASTNDYDKEQTLLESLYILGQLSKQEFAYKKALCYEREAMYYRLQSQENHTIMPSISTAYQNAFNAIYNYRQFYIDDYNRIRKELEIERAFFAEVLSQTGIRTQMYLDESFINKVKNHVANTDVCKFYLLINECNNIPLVVKGNIDDYCRIAREKSPIVTAMGVVKSDENGLDVGKASPEKALCIEAHKYSRMRMGYIVVSLLNKFLLKHDSYCQDDVYALLYEYCPNYIEHEKLILWTIGICSGLNNDFIIAAHLLIPQVERALCNKAKQYDNTLVHLELNHQDQPTLGSALGVLKNHMAKEIYDNIEGFLQEGADTNFRNNLAHGLMYPSNIDRNGLYLWWMALKIFFCPDELFKDNL